MLRLLRALLFLAVPVLYAQDCTVRFTFTVASGTISGGSGPGGSTTSPFNNKGTACVNWQLNVFASGIGALSLQLETASDLGTTPNTFSAFQGSVLTGNNPTTTTTQSTTTFTGMYPWIRVNAASATGSGTVTGVAYGFKATSSGINPVFGPGAGPCKILYSPACVNPSGMGFTSRNFQTGETITQANGLEILNILPFNSSGDTNVIYGRDITVPSTPYSIILALTICSQAASDQGFYITDGTKYTIFDFGFNGANITQSIQHCTTSAMSSCAGVFGPLSAATYAVCSGSPLYIKIFDNGTTTEVFYATNGYDFRQIRFGNSHFSETDGSFVTTTRVGYFATSPNGNYQNTITLFSAVQGTS